MYEVEKRYNTKVKFYPSGQKKATIATRNVFKEKREVDLPELEEREKIPKPKNMDNPSRNDSVVRAKTKVYDIAACTYFTHFVTLTLSSEYVDRYSPKAIVGKLTTYLSNCVQRGKLTAYLLVPEFHKDGGIHFHGFFSGNVGYVDSDTVKVNCRSKPIKTATARRLNIPPEEWRTVYNISSWSYGFSTAIELTDDLTYAAKYATKYITKDCCKIFKHFYFAGGPLLVREAPYRLTNVAYPHLVKADNKKYCEYTDCYFKYLDSYRAEDKEQLDELGL